MCRLPVKRLNKGHVCLWNYDTAKFGHIWEQANVLQTPALVPIDFIDVYTPANHLQT